MPVCAGLVVWGTLDGATRGRCLIVLWGRGALCQRTGFQYTAVVVAVGCMPGCGLGGIWMCTLYYWLCVSSMYEHWYWRAVVRGPSFWISRAGESGGVVHVAWSLGGWEAGVAGECRLCWCLHTGTWCTWGIDQLSCFYFTGICPHAASDSDREWLHKSEGKLWICICKHVWGAES